jgi:TRAP-type uncharacterized transport system fused permease subunit
VGMALFHIYTAGWRPFPGIQQRAVHLSLALALVFLLFPFSTKGDEEGLTAEDRRPLNIIDLILVLVSLAVGAYVFVEYEALMFRMDSPTVFDIFRHGDNEEDYRKRDGLHLFGWFRLLGLR